MFHQSPEWPALETQSGPNKATIGSEARIAAHPSVNEINDDQLAHLVVTRANELLKIGLCEISSEERVRAAKASALVGDPDAKRLSMAMTDRLIRTSEAHCAGSMFTHLVKSYGLPEGFSPSDRIQLGLGAIAAKIFPDIVMKLIQRKLRQESRSVILSADEPMLSSYLASKRKAGLKTNVNQLGEAVLGEEEATARQQAVIALLDRPDVNYISVKLSAIFSKIQSVAWDWSVTQCKERLRPIYRKARTLGKFVNLDMEEYRDLDLTRTVFCELLDEPEFHDYSAGIVLQAYLPDSYQVLRELTEWAQIRVQRGAKPIKIRLVKGANLAMEQVEAELHGWHQAPYANKADTDANFRRMMDFICRSEHSQAVRVGVASHNLYDVGLAMILRESRQLGNSVEIEMLEGMANHQARAVVRMGGSVLLYAPIVHEKDFGAALAYLIRRLDENTAPGNFLSNLFRFTPESTEWREEEMKFRHSWAYRHDVTRASNRLKLPCEDKGGFHNEPDTDFTQRRHRESLVQATIRPLQLPPFADWSGIDAILSQALEARHTWTCLPDSERAAILERSAKVLAEARFEIISLLQEEGKKAVLDADAEVSEAIDFARYYAKTGLDRGQIFEPLGTVLIAPPWNFPFAIPCGGILASLMAGNTVVFKPAPETRRLGLLLAELLWAAGVPRNVLQFLIGEDSLIGRSLIEDRRISAVILTGAYETARLFQSWRPELPLFAETSGKNSLIITRMADRDLAIKDLVRSAFGHSGQKCSAASLAILEAEIYDDPHFLRQLRDAAQSLTVAPAREWHASVTPLIGPPEGKLLRALTTLDEGESWLLQPRRLENDPCHWTPGIKLGIKSGSWFHQTECFGPVLGLMRAENLAEAMEFQNSTAYGLTAGLHSLDEREVESWQQSVQAGNLYINRPITGAIVQRQPFGGWKRSSIGPGAKAGGPNYVNLFRKLIESTAVDATRAFQFYQTAWRNHFSQEHDPSGLVSEKNVFRYRPCKGVILRLPVPDEKSIAMAKAAATVVGCPLQVSVATEVSDERFLQQLPQLAKEAEFVRCTQELSAEILVAAHALDLNIIHSSIQMTAEIELPRWLREQSISRTMHRYGNLSA